MLSVDRMHDRGQHILQITGQALYWICNLAAPKLVLVVSSAIHQPDLCLVSLLLQYTALRVSLPLPRIVSTDEKHLAQDHAALLRESKPNDCLM